MKKFLLFLLSIIGALVIFSGCAEKKDEGPYVVVDDPPPYYVYGLLEECTDGTKYCTLKSIEITSSYDCDGDIKDSGSGYYVIIGADTNLSESDLSNSYNEVNLQYTYRQLLRLKFLKWDAENGKLIYEIPYNESLDYARLCNLKVTNKKPVMGESEEPALRVSLQVLFYYYSHDYFVIDGVQYCGRYFWLELA